MVVGDEADDIDAMLVVVAADDGDSSCFVDNGPVRGANKDDRAILLLFDVDDVVAVVVVVAVVDVARVAVALKLLAPVVFNALPNFINSHVECVYSL